MNKYSTIDLIMENRNTLILLLNHGLFDIITANHLHHIHIYIFYSSNWLPLELKFKLITTYLLTYCLYHFAAMLKYLKIDYKWEKKMPSLVLEKLAQFPRSAFQCTKYHMSSLLVILFFFLIWYVSRYILTISRTKVGSFEFLILSYFRKKIQAELSLSPHSSIKYPYTLS